MQAARAALHVPEISCSLSPMSRSRWSRTDRYQESVLVAAEGFTGTTRKGFCHDANEESEKESCPRTDGAADERPCEKIRIQKLLLPLLPLLSLSLVDGCGQPVSSRPACGQRTLAALKMMSDRTTGTDCLTVRHPESGIRLQNPWTLSVIPYVDFRCDGPGRRVHRITHTMRNQKWNAPLLHCEDLKDDRPEFSVASADACHRLRYP